MNSVNQRLIIAMMDGLDMAYLAQIKPKNFTKMMEQGYFKEVSGVFPSVTNVNNVSIACGAWPNEHGISANSYFDQTANKPRYMNSSELITCPTIFERAKRYGVKSALLTSKKKTLELFHKDVEIGIAAEAATPEIIEKYGQPADIYSAEINYWLWQTAITILKERQDIGMLYVHITDYPMHAWGPEKPESKVHLDKLDDLIGEALKTDPEAAFLATADHGMNYKAQCWDLKRVLDEKGISPRFVLSPERDYYIVHHRNFTGCSWIWLNDPADENQTIQILRNLEGVEEVMNRDEAVQRFNLIPDHIGDLIITGDPDTMFGEMDNEYERLPSTYRAHGSLYEMSLPFIVWNHNFEMPPKDEIEYNLQLTRHLFR